MRGVAPDGGEVFFESGFDGNVFRNRSPQQTQHIGNQAGHVHSFGQDGLLSGIGHELAHHSRRVVRHGFYGLDSGAGGRPAGELRGGEFGVGHDAAQQIVEVVRNAAGQHSQALEFLPFQRLCVIAAEFGNVGDTGDVARENIPRTVVGNALAKNRAVFSIGPPQAVFDVAFAPLVEGRTVSGIGGLVVVGVHALYPAGAQFLLHGSARKRQPSVVKECGEAIRTGHADHHRRRVGDHAEALLALAHRGFGAPPLPQGEGLPKRDDQGQAAQADAPGHPSRPLGGRHQVIGDPGVLHAVTVVSSHDYGQCAVGEHVSEFAPNAVSRPLRLKSGGDPILQRQVRDHLCAQLNRAALGGRFPDNAQRDAPFEKCQARGAVTEFPHRVAGIRNLNQPGVGIILVHQPDVEGHLVQGNAPRIRGGRGRGSAR